MSHTIEQLRAMSDEQLIQLHDQRAERTEVGIAYYLDELARRAAARSADRIERLTDTVRRLTWVITVLTAVSAIAAVVAAWVSIANA